MLVVRRMKPLSKWPLALRLPIIVLILLLLWSPMILMSWSFLSRYGVFEMVGGGLVGVVGGAILLALACALATAAFLYLFWVVHCTLDRIIVRYARRFCSRRGLEISRIRLQPAFEPSGDRRVKTEYTLVQLDCLDSQKQRRLVLVLAWPLGVRKLVSDEIYPESYDSQWPQKCA